MGLKILAYCFFTLICIPGLCAFTLVPSQNPVAVGTNVTISAINDSPISITIGSWLFGASTLFIWFGEDVITGSGHQAGIEFNNSTYQLTLSSVALNSSGKYVLESFKPSKVSSVVTLDVQEPVSNVNASVSVTNVVEFNDTVTFTCSASGTPLWFSWLNGSSAVTQGGRVQLNNNGQNLIISGVTRYDEGPFKCIVVNNISKGASDQMTLNISYGPSNLRIAASPEKIVYTSGSAISLSCSAESKPTASFYWMFNGNALNVYGSTYNLSNITPNTTGLYTCAANNAATQRYVAVSKTINVVDPISAVALNPSGSPVEGMPFNLSCIVVGPVDSIQWMKNDMYLSANDMITFLNGNSTLSFKKMALSDDGQYKCAASNAVSNMSSQYNLTVSYGPWNLTIEGPTMAQIGPNVTFSCSAASRPESQFSWFHNGLHVGDGQVFEAEALSRNNSGNYTCTAFNSITGNSVSASLQLTLKYPITHVTVNADNQQPIFNQPFTLTCNANGDVEHIQWMKNDMFLYPVNGIIFSSDNSTLTFQNLSLSDDGHYKCEARNIFSNFTSEPYDLMVNYGPWNLTIEGPTMAQIGSNVTFSCSADSRPQSQYSWFHNGLHVGDGQVFEAEALSRNNSGNYTCTAFNSITGNSVSASLQLTLKYPVTHVTVNADNQQPIFNQPFTLTCNANGDVEHIQWMKNDMFLYPVNGITFSNDNSTLTFQNLSLSDDGHYKCEARNTVSNFTSEPYDLMVNYGPWNLTIEGPTMAQIGSNVTFSCSAASRPESQFSWFHNGLHVGDGQVFEAEALSRNNSGNYTCTAFNSITGNSVSASLQLTLKYPITHVTVNAENQQPIFNQPFTLTCNANGDVEHIQWMKNEMFLSPVNGITFSSDNSTLTFQNLSLSDDGHYKCEARNTVSNFTSEPYDLMVNYGPWNLTIEGPNMTEIGSNVTFICSAASHPQSQYSWFHNGLHVGDGQVFVAEALSRNNSGNYTCTAFNSITGNSVSASLQFTAIDPLISVDLTADRLIPLASQSLQLTCKVNGPYDKIYWLRNNLTFQPSNGITFSADNTIVTFQSLQTANEGKYQCFAKNALKDLASPRYDLVVIFGPQSVQIIVHPGIPPKMTCQAVSQPPAVFHWINENDTVVGNDSTIVVPIKYILGSNYTCVAKNPLTNVTVYTSQVINYPNAAVSVQASVVLTVLLALLLPLLKE